MPFLLSTRVQTALVVLLLVGSLAVLLFTGFSSLLLPMQESEIRERVREASSRLAQAAASAEVPLPQSKGNDLEPTFGRLHKITERVLADYPGVEGGFYLSYQDRFGAYAYPTAEAKPAPKGKAKAPPPRHEPPPLESPLIRAQAQQSLELPVGEFLTATRDVRLSRVLVVTEPVGDHRPAALATWVMFRLTRPEQMQDRARRYAVSTALALGGIVLSLVLTWNLSRSLRRQRQEQERLRDELRRAGAYDYITKPFDLDEVLFTIRRALTQKALVAQVEALTAAAQSQEGEGAGDEELIGRTPAMLQVFKTVGRVAATSEAVLITGESGTGKELVASAIHHNSDRASQPFIKVNCAALTPTLLESELFGHEKGAFTGAVARRAGRFEQANSGTLFLDEVGELDVDLQAKLLRVLQTGQFERVGGNETLQVDVRVISATNRDLQTLIAAGRFREDLFYRLNVVSVELPPLRARREDVPLLAEHVVRRFAQKYHWPHLSPSPEAIRVLYEQAWPGNVRQLQNVLARAAILARNRPILPEDLQPLPSSEVGTPAEGPRPGALSLKEILAETERRVILQALEQENWNRTRAAQVLGISRRQLFDKIQQYGLQK